MQVMRADGRFGGLRALLRPDHSLPYLAAVIAMVMVSVLYLWFQNQSGQAEMHQRGIALAKLISGYQSSSDQVLDQNNLQRLFEHQLIDSSFAYGVIEDATGQPVGRMVTRSVVDHLPPLQYSQATWLQSREVAVGDTMIQEYYGPIGNGGSGHFFRFGFHQPELGLEREDLRVGATLGLPIFLLVPLFLFFHARSSRPLKDIGEKLADIVDGKAKLQHVEITADGELAAFIQQFNGFVDKVQGRLSSAERMNRKLLTQEKFLSYQSERFESILQTVPDGILIVDEDLKLVFINQHVESMFDVQLDAVIAAPLPTWCNHQQLLDFVLDLKVSGQSSTNKVVHMPHPDGRHTLGVSAHSLCFRHGPATSGGSLILLRDVSEEIAARQSRVDFVGALSHEIKAPLNTIGLYAQMLETNGDDPEFRIETHNVITREVERLTRLVHNLLSITQIEMGTFELDAQRVHLVDVVKDCISIMDHGEDRARIRLQASDKITPVQVDKELLRVAVSNLVTNALKYSADDRPVTIEIDEDDDAIRLSVIDQGLGISQEDQERIFDKFYRSSNPEAKKKAGHGLGLSIAAEIVKLHHGTLCVESELGKGSKFSIELWKRTGIAQRAI
jgi:two-component system sensor histidine kinase VicK